MCKKPSGDSQPILSCDGANALEIRWPTDLVFAADVVSVPADILQALEARIRNRGVTLDVTVFGAFPR